MAWFLFAAALAAGCGRGGTSPRSVAFDGDRALQLVDVQMSFGARYPGSAGHAAVQLWIEQGLRDAGWMTEGQDFSFEGVPLRNVVGRLESASGPLVILGAHYDTRPRADRDSIDPTAPVPGADDGASGVAVLLELARGLAVARPACEVRLAFFDAEDSGNIGEWDWSLGARHFAGVLDTDPQAVVIVDMVGDRDLRLPRESNSTVSLVDSIWSAARQLGNDAFVDEAGSSITDDHIPFLERGWPAVDIIDIQYPYWHTTQDTADKLSADSLEQVGTTLAAWLSSFCVPPADG
ncbi:MAG TPA: M28 family peptidase [Anaerolineales bacterium]|nr:M28 family peptidase [Anaerolineales bacterium]